MTPLRTSHRAEIEAVAARFGLEADLVEAIVVTESGGNERAYRFEPMFWLTYMQGKPEYAEAVPERVSSSYGLMQIMYPVACEMGFRDEPEQLFVPTIGLTWGCEKYRSLLTWANGDIEQACAAYNGGRGGNASRPFRNQAYVEKVLHNLALVKGVD